MSIRQHDRRGMSLSEALVKARWRLGYDQVTAANILHLFERELLQYESGMRHPSPSVLEEMAAVYGFEASRLGDGEYTATFPPKLDEERNVLWLGWTAINLGDRSNEHVLRSVALVIRSMRGTAEDAAIHLRFTDKPMLAKLLDLDESELPDRMQRHLGLDAESTEHLLADLRKLRSRIERKIASGIAESEALAQVGEPTDGNQAQAAPDDTATAIGSSADAACDGAGVPLPTHRSPAS